jgi:hypothetical protein
MHLRQFLPAEVMGVLTRLQLRTGPPFLLIVPNVASADAKGVAGLVALSMLDLRANLMKPTLMPVRGPIGVLRGDGSVRVSLIRRLPIWAIQEHQRLAAALLEEHGHWISNLVEIVRGEKSSQVAPPPRFPLIAGPGDVITLIPPSLAVDTSGAERMYRGLERHQVVRLDYEHDRYMQHLTNQQLIQRGNDIFRNIHQVDELGRITLAKNEIEPGFWIGRFTEVLHEALLRGLNFEDFAPGVIQKFPFPPKSDVPKRVSTFPKFVLRLSDKGME